MTHILGISAFYHDSAAALVRDGDIVAAVQEERFTREKYDARFPSASIEFCLKEAGIGPEQLDYVVFYEQPLTKFERLIETYIGYAPDGFNSFRQAIPVWLSQKLHLRRHIRKGLGKYKGPILFPDHHESHAASAFFSSPYDEAAILTLDGVGEWSTTTTGFGKGNKIQLLEQIRFPHSLGLLYSAFTYYCGFKVNSGEYKLMGLAPYGRPVYVDRIKEKLVDIKPDGSFHLNLDYFTYCQGLTMTGSKFDELFGGPARKTDSRLEQRHMDLAASIQRVAEEIMMRSAIHVWEKTGQPKNLVMAGGVALNCVANGKLLRDGPYENIWIQPAAGDAGGALGAALFTWYHVLGKPRQATGHDTQRASLLGPHYETPQIRAFLDGAGARYNHYTQEPELLDRVAHALAEGKIVGWFHGPAEFGPRALGARSIIGDPRNPTMQADLNLKIKFRESFRPFAPCVLREHVHEWFGMRPGEESPYMLMVAPVLDERRKQLTADEKRMLETDPDLSKRVNIVRSDVPAITHVDYSARVQTVDERHGRYYRLMQRFHEITGCPIIVNTSFNLSWEPIVLTPEEAYNTFMQSHMDVLVLEDCVLEKTSQPLGIHSGDSPWTVENPPVKEGIVRLFVPGNESSSAANRLAAAGYDDLNGVRALLEDTRAGLFARLLNEQIPYNARVVEIGCGDGQLTNFLSIAHRSVIGCDASLEALRVAQKFKTEHGLERSVFAHMNPSKPALREGYFDVVIVNGFREGVARLVRPGGFVVVGVSSAFGRRLYNMTHSNGHHPESYHTINEVIEWMDRSGIEFVNCLPKTGERVFERRDRGTALSRLAAEIGHGSSERGALLVVGQRPEGK